MSGKHKNKPFVFVSHSRDERFLRCLKRYLSRCEVRILEWENTAGEILKEEVKLEIEKADVFVVVLTESAGASPWVNQEIGYAIGLGKQILPVVEGKPHSMALLDGFKVQPYDPRKIEGTAKKTAARVNGLVREALTLEFDTFHKYQAWWLELDESIYTNGVCYWATPHDTWSWIMAHANKAEDRWYRTLIRGDSKFDKDTIDTHYQVQDGVCGVGSLARDKEEAVIGALTIDVEWDEGHWRRLEDLLSRSPDIGMLIRWYNTESDRQTRIKVRMTIDQAKAERRRARLERLYLAARKTTRRRVARERT